MIRQKTEALIRKTGMFENCTGIIAGVSGGPDSMAMLHFLTENKDLFPFRIVCATVNHNLRPEAGEEAEGVKEYCRQHEIIFELLSADIRKDCPRGVSLEDYARTVRYAFFESLKKQYAFSHIATAHTADDNCESRLMNLIRGCGSDGLEGIAPLRKDLNAARPLLYCTKQELTDYCEKNGIPYFIDKTNFENDHRRNIIRNRILPELKELNPDFSSTLDRLSQISARANDYIRKEAEKLRKEAENTGVSLDFSLKILSSAHPAVLSELLRDAGRKTAKRSLTFAETEKLLELIGNAKPSSRVDFPGGYARISFGRICFFSEATPETFSPFIPKEGKNRIGNTRNILILKKTICRKDGGTCICDFPIDQLTVRPRKQGDYLHPEERTCGRSLKKLMCDKKIPPEWRDKIPVLISPEGQILWTAISGREKCAVPEENQPCIQIQYKEFE